MLLIYLNRKEEKVMKKIFILSLSLLALFCVVEASQNYLEAAESFVYLLSQGKYAKAENMFSSKVSQALPTDRLEALWKSLEEKYGEFQSLSISSHEKSNGYTIVVVKTSFERMNLNFKLIFNGEMKIAGLWIKPAPTYHLPPYADFSKFIVKKLEIGNKWKLPAELTVPKGKGPFTAVVFIGGSGPTDMNESIGNQRPFEDLAYGLSSTGIVVLRYDKRPHVYGKEMIAQGEINVKDVYLQDASYAIEEVEKLPFVKKVFLLGNSLGAYLLPEIAKENPSVSGLIMLSAPARTFADVLSDQLKYILKFSPNNETLEKLLEEVKLLKLHKIKPDQMVLGAPASYYYELEKYAPIPILKKLSKPVLICHGGKDYQVPQKDFEMFERAFSSNKLFTFKTYPNLSHVFTPVNGIPSPANYEVPENVSKEVVEDIASWLKNH